MTGEGSVTDPHPDPINQRTGFVLLALTVIIFLTVRVPVMYRTMGGQDEDYYAVPGLMILKTGVPSIPYVPSRDIKGVFYRTDEVLFALPPLFFYWQAPFEWFFGPGYGSGRLASAIAGCFTLIAMYIFAVRTFGSRIMGLSAAFLFSFARMFYFPAMCARPDLLCALFGFAAIWSCGRWSDSQSRRWLFLSAVFLGLAAITHPFAIIFSLQVGVWVLLNPAPFRQKSLDLLTVVSLCIAIVCVWLMMAMRWPEQFLSQFCNNVLNRAGPGLISRFLAPMDSLRWHWSLLKDYIGSLQLALLAIGLVAMSFVYFATGNKNDRRLILLSWSSVLLLIIVQGNHPAKGYWCYPGIYLFLCLSRLIDLSSRRLSAARAQWMALVLSLLALAFLLPGSGLRTSVAHFKNWNKLTYNSPRLVSEVLADLPASAEYLVDVSYVFDVYLSGRKTTLALQIFPYFEARGTPYDYLIVGPTGIEQKLPDLLDATFVKSYGDKNDPFANYLEVYRSNSNVNKTHTATELPPSTSHGESVKR